MDRRRRAVRLTVRDRKIVADSEVDTEDDGFETEVWDPFARWIKAERPEDIPVNIDDEQSWWQTTDEAIALWATRVDEYVPFVLNARESYPADVAAICATQADQLGELAAPPEGALDQLASWSAAAAEIMKQAHAELTALAKPPVTDTVAYSDFYGPAAGTGFATSSNTGWRPASAAKSATGESLVAANWERVLVATAT